MDTFHKGFQNISFEGVVVDKLHKDHTQIIMDSIADGVFTVNSDRKITSFNRAAEEITGIHREEAIGRYCWEVFKASVCEKHCMLRETMQTGRSYINQPVFIQVNCAALPES